MAHNLFLFAVFICNRVGYLFHFQPEGYIVVSGHMRIQRIALENHCNIPAFGVDVVNKRVAYVQLSVGNFFKPRNHSQRCGLAAAGRADEHYKLAVLYFHIKVLYRNKFLIRLRHFTLVFYKLNKTEFILVFISLINML